MKTNILSHKLKNKKVWTHIEYSFFTSNTKKERFSLAIRKLSDKIVNNLEINSIGSVVLRMRTPADPSSGAVLPCPFTESMFLGKPVRAKVGAALNKCERDHELLTAHFIVKALPNILSCMRSQLSIKRLRGTQNPLSY